MPPILRGRSPGSSLLFRFKGFNFQARAASSPSSPASTAALSFSPSPPSRPRQIALASFSVISPDSTAFFRRGPTGFLDFTPLGPRFVRSHVAGLTTPCRRADALEPFFDGASGILIAHFVFRWSLPRRSRSAAKCFRSPARRSGLFLGDGSFLDGFFELGCGCGVDFAGGLCPLLRSRSLRLLSSLIAARKPSTPAFAVSSEILLGDSLFQHGCGAFKLLVVDAVTLGFPAWAMKRLPINKVTDPIVPVVMFIVLLWF